MKLTPDIISKIRQSKRLKGTTIAQVVMMDDYLRNLSVYIKQQREEREQARRSIPKGTRLPAHVIDKIEALGLLDSATSFATEYCNVLNKLSKLNSAEREYVFQLGQQAYNVTIVDILCKEFPELKKELK